MNDLKTHYSDIMLRAPIQHARDLVGTVLIVGFSTISRDSRNRRGDHTSARRDQNVMDPAVNLTPRTHNPGGRS